MNVELTSEQRFWLTLFTLIVGAFIFVFTPWLLLVGATVAILYCAVQHATTAYEKEPVYAAAVFFSLLGLSCLAALMAVGSIIEAGFWGWS